MQRRSWSLAAAPAAWLAAGSEIVALARQVAVPDNGQWIPDEADAAKTRITDALATQDAQPDTGDEGDGDSEQAS